MYGKTEIKTPGGELPNIQFKNETRVYSPISNITLQEIQRRVSMSKFKVLTGIFPAVLFIFGGFFSVGIAAPTANFIVAKTADDGTIGTLRWAISQSNSNGVPDLIYFSIPTLDPNYDSSNG